jgi:ABC-type transport system involved in cytochrome bd biosynthesis fused ATPase/permease subunit
MRKIIILIFAIIFLVAFLGAKTAAYILLGITTVLAILLTLIVNRKRKPNAEKDWVESGKLYDKETKSYKIRSRGFKD